MKLSHIIEGLQILSKYYETPDGYHTCAEHDVLHAYATPIPLSGEDLKRMYELGWGQEGREREPAEYDKDEGWYAFT